MSVVRMEVEMSFAELALLVVILGETGATLIDVLNSALTLKKFELKENRAGRSFVSVDKAGNTVSKAP